MRSKQPKSRFAIATLAVLLLLLTIATSCFPGRVQQPKGWSGIAVSRNTAVIGSSEGKLVFIDLGTDQPTPKAFLRLGTAVWGVPAVGNDVVYVSGYDGKIYAYRIDSRDQLGSSPQTVGRGQPVIGSPLVSDGRVYIGASDRKVYALDADSLEVAWEQPFTTGDKIWASPAIDDETIFITSMDKKIYALDAATGKGKWRQPFTTGGAIVASPTVYKNTVYFGSMDRYVYAVNIQDGTLKWKSEVRADSWFWTTVIAHNNVIFAPSLDGKVYILNANDGRQVRDALNFDSPISSAPVLVGNSMVLATEGGEIHTLEVTSFQRKRLGRITVKNTNEPAVRAPLAAKENIVYVHASDDTLHAFDVVEGRELWDQPVSLREPKK